MTACVFPSSTMSSRVGQRQTDIKEPNLSSQEINVSPLSHATPSLFPKRTLRRKSIIHGTRGLSSPLLVSLGHQLYGVIQLDALSLKIYFESERRNIHQTDVNQSIIYACIYRVIHLECSHSISS